MSFTNRFCIGVNNVGYVFFLPPKSKEVILDDDALEMAALIVAMKPDLREKFNEILKKIEET